MSDTPLLELAKEVMAWDDNPKTHGYAKDLASALISMHTELQNKIELLADYQMRLIKAEEVLKSFIEIERWTQVGMFQQKAIAYFKEHSK